MKKKYIYIYKNISHPLTKIFFDDAQVMINRRSVVVLFVYFQKKHSIRHQSVGNVIKRTHSEPLLCWQFEIVWFIVFEHMVFSDRIHREKHTNTLMRLCMELKSIERYAVYELRVHVHFSVYVSVCVMENRDEAHALTQANTFAIGSCKRYNFELYIKSYTPFMFVSLLKLMWYRRHSEGSYNSYIQFRISHILFYEFNFLSFISYLQKNAEFVFRHILIWLWIKPNGIKKKVRLQCT